MKLLRCLLVVGLVASSLTALSGASAHPRDEMWPNKAGPIIRGETTMSELRDWFGPPDSSRVIMVQCIRVVRARWEGLQVYAERDKVRTADALFVNSRVLESTEHGELRIHTGKGLRVGDRHRKLKRLYPNADPIEHGGRIHYRLKSGNLNAKMLGKVVDGRVVRLEAWPFEFC
jgi:hypothetical protein